MAKVKFLGHIGQQPILCDEYKFSVNVLKRLDFVMHLNKNRFRGHFPVHAVCLIRAFGLVAPRDAKLLEEALPFGPNGTGRV